MDTQSHSPVFLPSFAELLLSIGSLTDSARPLSLPDGPSSGATTYIRKAVRRKKRKNLSAYRKGKSYRHGAAIGILPDNVLLEILDLCQENLQDINVWRWRLLVHVCRRWRQVIFESPHRLNLQILCTYRTPVRKNLGIWPALPIVIDYSHDWRGITPDDEDNVITALEQPDRVHYLKLDVMSSQLEKMTAVMQEPFPILTRLDIFLMYGNAPALPCEFLGGSAPSLRSIVLSGIPYPTLQTLLLSTSDLVELSLHNIPPTGYISPKEMVVGLAALPRLQDFTVEFQSATSRPDRIRPPPITRTVLPALTFFRFVGASEYLEDLVSQIDGPQLDGISIVYLNQLVDFQAAQLSKFIDRSVGPKFTIFKVQVTFFDSCVTFDVYGPNHPRQDWRGVSTTISCEGVDWQVSHMAQVLSHFSTTLSNVVHLELEALPDGDELESTDDVEWLHFFHHFSTVQTLHVSWGLSEQVALALEDITGEMVAEVLPSLDLTCLEGLPASFSENFVAVRRLAGRPVTVFDKEWEFVQRVKLVKSYIGK